MPSGTVPNNGQISSFVTSKIKSVIISGTVTTGTNAGYRFGTAQAAVGGINFTAMSGYPTGKTILAIIPRGAYNSTGGSVQRGILEVNSATGGFVFANPSTTLGCYFQCLYFD